MNRLSLPLLNPKKRRTMIALPKQGQQRRMKRKRMKKMIMKGLTPLTLRKRLVQDQEESIVSTINP